MLLAKTLRFWFAFVWLFWRFKMGTSHGEVELRLIDSTYNGNNVKGYLKSLWFRVIWAGFLLTFSGGVVFGFAAIKPVLLESKVFGDLCGNAAHCVEQDLAINRIFQIAGAG